VSGCSGTRFLFRLDVALACDLNLAAHDTGVVWRAQAQTPQSTICFLTRKKWKFGLSLIAFV